MGDQALRQMDRRRFCRDMSRRLRMTIRDTDDHQGHDCRQDVFLNRYGTLMENPPCTASDRFTTGRWSDPSCRRKPTARIIIPDTAKEKPIEGEVLAVGAGARDETGRVTLLDVNVLFGP
jgi:hypothetical protein